MGDDDARQSAASAKGAGPAHAVDARDEEQRVERLQERRRPSARVIVAVGRGVAAEQKRVAEAAHGGEVAQLEPHLYRDDVADKDRVS